MENNTVMNEVVVENAPMAIEEINKTNVVDAVKYLATSCKKTFETIDENEAAFIEDIDALYSNIAVIDALQKKVDGLTKGLYGLTAFTGVCAGAGAAALYFLNKKNKKKADVVVEAEEVEEEEVE